MTSGNRGLGLIVAALFGALAMAQSKPMTAPEAAISAKAASSAEPASSSRPSHESDGAAPQPRGPDCSGGERLFTAYDELYGDGTFRFLLALVPDPEESGHTDYFDAVLEGVEDAIASGTPSPARKEQRHYVRDHHWFPWPGSDDDKRNARCWESVPGVVLYRPLDAPALEPFALLLVGETPTWGVREKQLGTALERIQREGSGSSTIHILGPTFSGSAPSLARAIANHVERSNRNPGALQGSLDFRIVSGTATGGQVKAVLDVPEGAGRRYQTTYRSAIPGDDLLLGTMLDYLAKTGAGFGERGRTVVLTESMTAYGESVSRRAGGGGTRQPLQIRFPPNLASIRRAYLEVEQKDPQTPILFAPSAMRAAPQEHLGELSEQTPITHDLALASVLRELGDRSVRNVGIVATDARDVVFMARRIKRQLPDVRLFTSGFDIRYLHPDHASVLNGMLVVHAADERAAATTVQKNPMSRGVFWAGRDLLANERTVPRARVSLIGNGVLWQMGSDVAAGGDTRRPSFLIPRSFSLVYAASLAVFAVALLLVTGPSLVLRLASLGELSPLPEAMKRSGFLRQRTTFWSVLGNVGHLDLRADDAFATASFVTVALSAPVVMAAAAFRLDFGLGRVILSGTGVLLVLALTWRRTHGYAQKATPSAFLLGLAVSGIGLLATGMGCTEPREATFSLLSGGSPLVGSVLGLGMLLIVTWCWRARLRLLDNLCFGALPGARFFSNGPMPIARLLGQDSHSELHELEQRLLRVLRSPWGAAPIIPIMVDGLLVLSIGYVLVAKPPLTFEHGFRHWILIAFVSACIVPITTAFARILVTGQALQRLLRAVACLPVVGALRSLPPELARRLESQLARAGREVGELTYPVQTLERIGEADSAFGDEARECATELAHELAHEAGAPEHTGAKACTPHGPAVLVHRLLDIAGRLARARPGATPAGRELIDEYHARLLAIFVARYVRHLRLTVPAVLVGSVLAVLMTSLYFVQPQRMISTVCFVWISGMVIGIVGMYVALARDHVISNIGQTTAGTVTPSLGLAVRVAGAALVPLAGLFATRYPEFAYWVSQALGTAGKLLN